MLVDDIDMASMYVIDGQQKMQEFIEEKITTIG